MATSMKQ